MGKSHQIIQIARLAALINHTVTELVLLWKAGYITAYYFNDEMYFELRDVRDGLKKFQKDCETL